MDVSRLLVKQHYWEGGFWEMASSLPSARLSGRVVRYTGYREETLKPFRRRELPTASVQLIVSFGPELRLVEGPDVRTSGRTFTSFVAGMHDRFVVTEYPARQHGMQIELTSGGAYSLFGLPMNEITNRVVSLEELLGGRAEDFRGRLEEASDWSSRLAVLEALLVRWMEAGPRPSPIVERAWDRLVSSGGNVAIGSLAEEAGWSRKHLTDRFRPEVGLPPKRAARVMRLQRAQSLLRKGVSPAEAALRAGFFDQAHLNRAFRLMAGCTPTEFVAAQLPEGGGTGA